MNRKQFVATLAVLAANSLFLVSIAASPSARKIAAETRYVYYFNSGSCQSADGDLYYFDFLSEVSRCDTFDAVNSARQAYYAFHEMLNKGEMKSKRCTYSTYGSLLTGDTLQQSRSNREQQKENMVRGGTGLYEYNYACGDKMGTNPRLTVQPKPRGGKG